MKNSILFFSFIIISILNISNLLAQSNPILGYGFSPEGHPFDYSLMGDFLDEAANTCDGGVVLSNGSWRDSYATSGIIPGFQKAISSLQPAPYAYVDMLVYGWGTSTNPYTLYLNVPGDTTNKWTNTTAKNLFLQMLIHTADSLEPTYLFIGNEISFYWAQDSADFLNWVAFYHQAYDSIKDHSPTTKVGTVFNYEHLSGKGSLIGWTTPYWNSLNAFDTSKIDILGLTVYPFFSYSTANAIPSNYLDPIFTRMGNKPIAVTETGWPADSLLAGWTCSPQQQVDYVNKFFTLINGHTIETANWLFLYYLMDKTSDENKLCASIAMHDSLGNAQPALPVWLSYCNATNVADTLTPDQSHHVTIYPNPFSTSAIIETTFDLEHATFTIYNIYGEVVRKQSCPHGNTIHIERNELSSGVYFYQIKKNDFITKGKFIVE